MASKESETKVQPAKVNSVTGRKINQEEINSLFKCCVMPLIDGKTREILRKHNKKNE